MIRVSHLAKRAGHTTILRDINLEVASQSVLGIIGASGSGKTTLLRCLNGLERIDEGVIECGDVPLEAGLPTAEYDRRVTALRRKVGTVFQHLYLFPHLTVLGNLTEAPVHVLRNRVARPKRKRRNCWQRLVSARRGEDIRNRCQAVNNNGSQSREPWPCIPTCCCLTSPPVRSIRAALRNCASCCEGL
jgi:ABC-type polar amino acid transport system ATPase subunit